MRTNDARTRPGPPLSSTTHAADDEEWVTLDDGRLALRLTHPKDRAWHITAVFEVKADDAVIAEVSLLPIGGFAPPGGLTTKVVRAMSLDDLHKRVAQRVKSGAVPGYFGIDPARFGDKPRRAGRRGRTDLERVRLVQRYLALLDTPSPVKTLAEELHLSESSVRVLMYEARKRGFLTGAPGAGQAGGRLTNKAMWILAAAGEEDEGGT